MWILKTASLSFQNFIEYHVGEQIKELKIMISKIQWRRFLYKICRLNYFFKRRTSYHFKASFISFYLPAVDIVIIFVNSYQLTGYDQKYKPTCCKILKSCQSEECGRQLISPKMFGPSIMDKDDGKRNSNFQFDPHFDRQVNVCGVCIYKVWKYFICTKEIRKLETCFAFLIRSWCVTFQNNQKKKKKCDFSDFTRDFLIIFLQNRSYPDKSRSYYG